MKNPELDNRILEIAKKFKYLRKLNGWSSYETFAFDNDLDRKQYWRIENGNNFTIQTLLKILDIHKISLDDFFNLKLPVNSD